MESVQTKLIGSNRIVGVGTNTNPRFFYSTHFMGDESDDTLYRLNNTYFKVVTAGFNSF